MIYTRMKCLKSQISNHMNKSWKLL
jgi:hypothetical protein